MKTDKVIFQDELRLHLAAIYQKAEAFFTLWQGSDLLKSKHEQSKHKWKF